MNSSSDLRKGRNCVFSMHVHLVFVTKYRRNVFTKQILEALREIFQSVCQDFESRLVEFEGKDDHVHLLIEYPPKIAVSKLVNSLKGVSSRMWSPSYFAGTCGGAPLSVIRQYIEQQQSPII